MHVDRSPVDAENEISTGATPVIGGLDHRARTDTVLDERIEDVLPINGVPLGKLRHGFFLQLATGAGVALPITVGTTPVLHASGSLGDGGVVLTNTVIVGIVRPKVGDPLLVLWATGLVMASLAAIRTSNCTGETHFSSKIGGWVRRGTSPIVNIIIHPSGSKVKN